VRSLRRFNHYDIGTNATRNLLLLLWYKETGENCADTLPARYFAWRCITLRLP
jgi:hypothetical protein